MQGSDDWRSTPPPRTLTAGGKNWSKDKVIVFLLGILDVGCLTIETVGAKSLGHQIRCYFIGEIPKSLQIFFAKLLFISVCLGTDDLLFCSGFDHHECRLPSLINSHPWDLR
jgi:hypothetical protein